MKRYNLKNHYCNNLRPTKTDIVYPVGTMICDIYDNKTHHYIATIPTNRIDQP